MESANNSFKTVISLLPTILKSAHSVITVLFWSMTSSATALIPQTVPWAPFPEYSKPLAKDSVKSLSSKSVQFLPPTSVIVEYVWMITLIWTEFATTWPVNYLAITTPVNVSFTTGTTYATSSTLKDAFLPKTNFIAICVMIPSWRSAGDVLSLWRSLTFTVMSLSSTATSVLAVTSSTCSILITSVSRRFLSVMTLKELVRLNAIIPLCCFTTAIATLRILTVLPTISQTTDVRNVSKDLFWIRITDVSKGKNAGFIQVEAVAVKDVSRDSNSTRRLRHVISCLTIADKWTV